MAGNISEFDAGNLQLRPSQSGIEADVRSAYRLGAFGRQQAQAYDQEGRAIGGGVAALGEAAVQMEDHREISAGAKNGAQLLINAEQQWNAIAKDPKTDPNDPAVAQRFRDNVLEPALENFQNGFHTERSQAWAQQYIDRMRQHMDTKTSADMSSLAGIAAHDNAMQTANTLATAVYSDPSSLGMAFDTFDHSVGALVDSSPTISPEDAARVKETFGADAKKQMVSAAVHGTIANGGDWHSIADNPKYAPYINAPEIQQFERTEKFYRRGAEVEEKQKLILDREVATQNMHNAVNDSWSKNVSIDPSTGRAIIGPGFVRDMVQLPTTYHGAPEAAQTAKTYIDWTEQQQKPGKEASDPAAVSALDGRMFDREEPTSNLDVLKAEAAGKLTRQDGETRLQLIKARDAAGNPDPAMTDALREARDRIEPFQFGSGVRLNQDKSAAFQLAFMTEYQKEKAAGTLPANALDINDPKSLISTMMAPYRPALAQSVLANGGVGQKINTAPPAIAAPKIATKAAYDALAAGTVFIGEDGKRYRKP